MNITMIRSNAVNPDSRVEKEANSLSKLGHNVRILAWDREENYKLRSDMLTLQDSEIQIYRKGIKASFGGGVNNLIPLIKFQLTIILFLIKNRKEIEVVHACDFDTALSAFLFAKIYRKKMVYDIFDYYVEAFRVPNKLKKFIEKVDVLIINNVDVVIITADSRKKQIDKAVPKRVYVIHNSPNEIKESQIEKEKYTKGTKFKIGYVGVLGKGRFLEEASSVVAKDLELELYIGGFGELEKHFTDMGKKHDNIKFLGKMEYREVLQLESECDILFAIYDPKIPNHRYSTPNKLYEALMLGKPIIVAKGTGIDQLVDIEKVGKEIEYTEREFEQAIISIKERLKKEKEKIQEQNKEIYRQEFSWDIMEKRIREIYMKI